MKIKDLIKNKDYDYISYRMVLPEEYGDDVFIGAARSENGKLISLDGDYYSEDTKVISYEEWHNEEDGIKNGLTVIV